jgi:hypothetical protein
MHIQIKNASISKVLVNRCLLPSHRKFCTEPQPQPEETLSVAEQELRNSRTRIPRLIDKLPRYPLYEQLKELRTKMGNFVDCSEIDELVFFLFSVQCIQWIYLHYFPLSLFHERCSHSQEGVPVSEIEVFPLERTILNNPILDTDAPETRVDWPNEVQSSSSSSSSSLACSQCICSF